MKKAISTLFAIFLCLQLAAQNISVASFSLLENDLTANTAGTTVLDQNGEKCALIKVETTQTGFTFDVGSLGVVRNEQHAGEIWVYVPAGVKRITMAHPQLGILRDYDLGLSVQRARAYLLQLTTGTVTTVVTEAKQKTGWIIIDSQPQGASVYLNDDYVGNTPLDTYKAPYGHYTYRLELGNYHNASGMFDLNQPSYEVTIPLKPAFGSINVSSSVNGAQVLLDGKSTGKTTPCILQEVASGSHRLTIQMTKYAPKQLDVMVNDGETTQASATLDARFAPVTIQSLSGAQILIDGNQKGQTQYNEDLMEGYYDVEVRLAHHRPASKQIHVVVGQPLSLSLEPTPIYGSLDVMSSPRRANVSIDGQSYGQTPTTIEQLLEGDHTVTLSLEGYAGETRQISIHDGETASINFSLQNGREVSIQTDRTGDQIYADGVRIGTSPYHGILTFGNHTVYAMRDGKKSGEQQFLVSQSGTNPLVSLSFHDKRVYTVNGVSFTMIPVQGGTFQMGATLEQQSSDRDEKPVHSVTLSSYSIGETELTQALWQAVMDNNPSNFRGGGNLPVENVSWNDCQEFIRKLNQLTGATFRLPTEAEWEFAARGGNKSRGTQYAGSSNLDEVAWSDNNSDNKTHPVKTKLPNELGLYDMSGNVWEWCQDWYGNYSSSSQTNPTGPRRGSYSVRRGTGPGSGSIRVSRGGGWSGSARFCRSACRSRYAPTNRSDLLGFRLSL